MLKLIIFGLLSCTLVNESNQSISSNGELTLNDLRAGLNGQQYPGFSVFGEFTGISPDGKAYKKTFWFPSKIKATWIQARTLCYSYKMKMISLDSQAEADFFLPLFVQNSALFDSNLHIGAVSKIARDPLDWYWIDSGDKVNFAIKWRAGEPSYGGNNEMCLTLTKLFGTYDFNDIQCYEVWLSNMMCQTVTLI